MGHSDVSVTGNIYTDTTPDVINFAAAKMNNFYRDGGGDSQTECYKKLQQNCNT